MISASFHRGSLLARKTISARSRQFSWRTLDLAFKHNELLTKQGILQHKL